LLHFLEMQQADAASQYKQTNNKVEPDRMSPPASDKPAPLRILLLDDDSFTLDLLAEMLGQIDEFDIVAESDAKSALANMRAHPPQLLICDLSMPDMDGIEFLHVAAGTGFDGHVILLSGLHSGVRNAAERLARAAGLKLLGAFKKPLGADDMRSAVQQLQAVAK
jgi:DNA-binding NarL/FixJ family response regulator